MDNGGKKQEICFEDFKNYVLEEGDMDIRRRVAEAMEIEGSQVRRWMDELQRRASDPIDGIDWSSIAIAEHENDET